MSRAKDQLLCLLAQKSFRLGEFKLSSGGTSDYYIDCRTTTLDAQGARLTGEVFLDEIQARGWKAEAIGGLTMGADPIVVAASVAASHAGLGLHGFLVRKMEKDRGRRLYDGRIHHPRNSGCARIWLRRCGRDLPGGTRGSEGASGSRGRCQARSLRQHFYRE